MKQRNVQLASQTSKRGLRLADRTGRVQRTSVKRVAVSALTLLLILSGTLAPFKSSQAASCVLQGNTITVNCDFAPDTYFYTGTLTIDPGVTITAGSQSSPGLVTIYADDFVINGTVS